MRFQFIFLNSLPESLWIILCFVIIVSKLVQRTKVKCWIRQNICWKLLPRTKIAFHFSHNNTGPKLIRKNTKKQLNQAHKGNNPAINSHFYNILYTTKSCIINKTKKLSSTNTKGTVPTQFCLNYVYFVPLCLFSQIILDTKEAL